MPGTDGADFRNKKKALRKVSGALAALLNASDYDDIFGYSLNLTEAQGRRLEWAWEEVRRCLCNMGGQEELSHDH